MVRKKILIAEDDLNFGMVLKSFLNANGFEAHHCNNGRKALDVLGKEQFDLCIFDVMMPEMHGFELAENLKNARPVPFIYLTAKGMREDILKGLRLGAVDYLVKPFDPEILLVKLSNYFRKEEPQGTTVFQVGSFTFEFLSRKLRLNETAFKLSPKEAELLKLLCENKNSVLGRTEALNSIWGNDSYFAAQSMNVFITKLRNHLKKDPAFVIEIENIHGRGFILKMTAAP